jgi:hypothetical protein
MKKTYYLLFGLAMLLSGCVESITLKAPLKENITIIEGSVTNFNATAPLILKETSPTPTGGIDVNYVVAASVELIENGNKTIPYTEKEEGFYYLPREFKGTLGSTYQLRFTKRNGDVFESSKDIMKAGGSISQISQKTEVTGLSDAKGNKKPAIYVYLDSPDPADTKDFYMWDYVVHEKQLTCKTCIGGYYYRDPAPLGRCQNDQLLQRYSNIFDYICERDCWEVIRSSELVITSDVFYNGNTIKNQLIAKLPIYSVTDALITVNQYAINEQAYKFLDLSRKQGIETGGLADTPPASLVGNVKCVNKPNENVSGYFVVAGAVQKTYWIKKDDVYKLGLQIEGLLGGRATKYEPAGPNTTRPPLAPCVESISRTSIKPTGWVD